MLKYDGISIRWMDGDDDLTKIKVNPMLEGTMLVLQVTLPNAIRTIEDVRQKGNFYFYDFGTSELGQRLTNEEILFKEGTEQQSTWQCYKLINAAIISTMSEPY